MCGLLQLLCVTSSQPSIIGIALSDEFKQQVAKGYLADRRWSKVIQILRRNSESQVSVALPYVIRDCLLYTVDGCLCVPRALLRETLQVAHGGNRHSGIGRTIELMRGLVLKRDTS